MPILIYHNPACGTSRNCLALIRNTGVEPTIIEYLKTPADRATLFSLIDRMGIRPRELLREKGTPFAELGLGEPHWPPAADMAEGVSKDRFRLSRSSHPRR